MSGVETESEDWEHNLPRLLPPDSQPQSAGPSVPQVAQRANQRSKANQRRGRKRREGKGKTREVPEEQDDKEKKAPKKRGRGRPRKDQTAGTGAYEEHEASCPNNQRAGRAA